MTKKHFIELADTLKSDLFLRTPFTTEQRTAVVNALADFCKRQNGQFMRQRWIDYINGECGPNGGSIRKKSSPVTWPSNRPVCETCKRPECRGCVYPLT